MTSLFVLILMFMIFLASLVVKDSWSIFKLVCVGKVLGMSYIIMEDSTYLGTLYGFIFLFSGMIYLVGMQRVLRKKQSSQNINSSLMLQLLGIMFLCLLFGVISMFLYEFGEVIPELTHKLVNLEVLSVEFSKITPGKRAMVMGGLLVTMLIVSVIKRSHSDGEADFD